jgi:hypothetical protein
MANSEVRNTYYYYIPQPDAKGEEEIEYAYIGKPNSNFKPVYDANFEKVRSISKKETNRFDLLQTLSETFECWCRFNILHNEDGSIMLGKDFATRVVGGGANSIEK